LESIGLSGKEVYASVCDKRMLMGDLYFGRSAAIEVIESEDDSQVTGFVVESGVHPRLMDSYSKAFCGSPMVSSSGVDNDGRPYGFSFRLPVD